MSCAEERVGKEWDLHKPEELTVLDSKMPNKGGQKGDRSQGDPG